MVYKTFTDGSGSELSVYINQSKELCFTFTEADGTTHSIIIEDRDIDEFNKEIGKLYVLTQK